MTSTEIDHNIVSKETWIEARKALLTQEKELTHRRDEVSRLRRELPWTEVTENYLFDGPSGPETLSDLFDGRGQLIIYHFMFGPEWPEGCPSCSMVGDQIDGIMPHLIQRNAKLVVVSRAPLAKIEAFKRRMGWHFKWVSSYTSAFNADYNVTFTKDEMSKGEVYYNYGPSNFPADEAPGVSVFAKEAGGTVYHTYSAYARGLDHLLGVYSYLDLTPKGRDEDSLAYPMAWVRHHDRYETAVRKEADRSSCCAAGEQHT
jgi:predicted dithiol-disulfide oxidoreductase (DUF899 family)